MSLLNYSILYLVGGLVAIFHFPINIGFGIIIPTDELIFFRGVETQPPANVIWLLTDGFTDPFAFLWSEETRWAARVPSWWLFFVPIWGSHWRCPAKIGDGHMGVSFNGGTQKWLVYKGKPHLEMDDDWGYPIIIIHTALDEHVRTISYYHQNGSMLAIDDQLGTWCRKRQAHFRLVKYHQT